MRRTGCAGALLLLFQSLSVTSLAAETGWVLVLPPMSKPQADAIKAILDDQAYPTPSLRSQLDSILPHLFRTTAPLAEWDTFAAYDTAALCERERGHNAVMFFEQSMRDSAEPPKEPPGREEGVKPRIRLKKKWGGIAYQALLKGRCVPASAIYPQQR